MSQVAEDLSVWWARTGIQLKTVHGIEKMVLKLYKSYCDLRKNRSKKYDKSKTRRDAFVSGLGETFWVVNAGYEKILE